MVCDINKKRKTKGKTKKTDVKIYRLDESVKASSKFFHLFFIQA